MDKQEAEKIIQYHRKLIGQRWKNIHSGKVETVIDIRSIKLRNTNSSFAVTVVFIPESENIRVTIRECFIDAFFSEYTIINS